MKYLSIDFVSSLVAELVLWDLLVLKKKFPKLEVLILHQVIISRGPPGDEIDFEIRTFPCETDDEFFNSVPCITLEF